MGAFRKRMTQVKRGTKVTFSESDLRKLDRTYEREVIAGKGRDRVRAPFRRLPQQAVLTQVRDYAFERILDGHQYTFKHILVIPDPYDVVRQSALLLFNTAEPTKVVYRVIGDSAASDFTGQTEVTTRHRVAVLGLYEGQSSTVDLTLLDRDGVVKKHRVLRIYVPEVPDKLRNACSASVLADTEISDKADTDDDRQQTAFPFLMLSGRGENPFAVDCAGAVRYTTQLKTTNVGMFPLANGHFLYMDGSANRVTPTGKIAPCRYHEIDYFGRVYRTYLLDAPVSRFAAQRGDDLYLRLWADETGERALCVFNLGDGSLKRADAVPQKDPGNLSLATPVIYLTAIPAPPQGALPEKKDSIVLPEKDRMLSVEQESSEKKQSEKEEAVLAEMTCSTKKTLFRRRVSKKISRVWQFTPDIAAFGQPILPVKEPVTGSLKPPDQFAGTLPPLSEEPLDRDCFNNIRVCGDVLLCNILPGAVSNVYFVGKTHTYVQGYSKLLPGKRRVSFAIDLSALCPDVYQILVEIDREAYRLKNEIRVEEETTDSLDRNLV